VTEGSKPADAAGVKRALAALADPERAAWTAPYLGVIPGGYREGDVLLGIPVPAQRPVVLVERKGRDRDPVLRAELSALLPRPPGRGGQLGHGGRDRARLLGGELDETFALAERLMDDPHHLIHKATGWMLREAGKRDEAALVAFLDGRPRACRARCSGTRSSG
jgi:hypothetical protein